MGHPVRYKTKLVTAYTLILKLESDLETLERWLSTKYYYSKSKTQISFINAKTDEDATLYVVLDKKEALLSYIDLVNYTTTKSLDKR